VSVSVSVGSAGATRATNVSNAFSEREMRARRANTPNSRFSKASVTLYVTGSVAVSASTDFAWALGSDSKSMPSSVRAARSSSSERLTACSVARELKRASAKVPAGERGRAIYIK